MTNVPWAGSTFIPVILRRKASSIGWSAIALVASLVHWNAPAQAACDPAAAPGVTAVCSGVTINQGNGAPGTSAGVNGYGEGVALPDVTVTVLPGATVTGTVSGINLSGTSVVFNSGTVTGQTGFGVGSPTFSRLTMINSGRITGATEGVQFQDITSLINAGTITGGNRGVFASGITSLVNSGSIVGGNAGISTSEISSLTNSGLIQGGTFALQVQFGDTNLNLLQGSVLFGQIDLGGGTNTLNVGPGLSIANTFVGGAPVIGTTTGSPFAVNGTQVAVVDTTAMGQSDKMLSDLTSGIINAVHARLSGGAGGSNGSSAFGLGGSSLMGLGARMNLLSEGSPPPSSSDRRSGAWGQAFGGQRDEEATATSAQATHEYVGGIAGLDGWWSRSIQIGAFAGGATAKLDVPLSQDVDVDTFFGGAYANFTDGSNFLRVLLTAGTSDHDSTRQVANNLVAGGIEFATASFDGDFISPEVALGTAWRLGWLTIEPSARLRYAHLSLDGFTETGSAGNLTVGDRDVSLWLGRVQVAFPFASQVGTFSPRVGIEAWGSDDDTVSGVLLGQAVSFTPGGDDDDVTGFVGATASTSLGGGAHAFVDGEIHVGDDGYTRSEAHSGIRISF